jgi:UDP-glucose 4-epimerase
VTARVSGQNGRVTATPTVSSALVIGGAGFIGSHLVDRLLADGLAVDVVDDLSTGSLGNLAEARSMAGTLKIHHLDAGAPECASLVGMRRPDVVYHLAAVPRGDASPEQLASAFSTSMAVIEAARHHRVAKIVTAIPATAVYGRPASKEVPVKERPLEPRGVRGVVARATVDLLEIARDDDAIEFTALALANVYGPRQRPAGGVVAEFADAARARRSPVITGDGRQTRDFVYVDDVVDALVRAGGRGSGLVINIGTGTQTPVRDLWQLVGGPNGAEPAPAPAPVDELVRFAVSPVRARIHLGWSPWTELPDGIASLATI